MPTELQEIVRILESIEKKLDTLNNSVNELPQAIVEAEAQTKPLIG